MCAVIHTPRTPLLRAHEPMRGAGSSRARVRPSADQAAEDLTPVEIEITHEEKERDSNGNETQTVVNPGPDTVLRDEIVKLRVKIPPTNNADRVISLDVAPAKMRSQILGARGDTLMFDFGTTNDDGSVNTSLTTNANGTTKAGPYNVTLSKDAASTHDAGEVKLKAVFNKVSDDANATEGKFKIRISSPGLPDIESREFTITKRIRKYGKDNDTTTYDFNKYDGMFTNASDAWGAFYNHNVDQVERLKAIGMTESELGRNPQNQASRPYDIMTIGHPDDHVLDTLHHADGHHEKEVQPNYNTIRDLNYPAANSDSARDAINWGACWLYHKAQTISNNPNPPPDYIPGPWKSWDDATSRYNGGGVSNYLDRVKRALDQGRHPTDSSFIWPVLSNGKARR